MRASIRLWWSFIDRQCTARSGWSQSKKITPAVPAQGLVTGKNPNRGKNRDNKQPTTGTSSMKQLNVKILEKKNRDGWEGNLLLSVQKLKTDHSEETNAELAHI